MFVLAAVSILDLATTAIALRWGAMEQSPVGAMVLAAVGMTGLIGLKLVTLAGVWLMDRSWTSIGRAVGWGLAAMTLVAVLSNAHVLRVAAASVRGQEMPSVELGPTALRGGWPADPQ